MGHSTYSDETLAKHLRAEQLSPRVLALVIGVDPDLLEAMATQRAIATPDVAGSISRWIGRRAVAQCSG